MPQLISITAEKSWRLTEIFVLIYTHERMISFPCIIQPIHFSCSNPAVLSAAGMVSYACRIIFGAFDYLCLMTKLALKVQKEDNFRKLRLGDTNNPSPHKFILS